MRTGTPYIANAAPSVQVIFHDITNTQVGYQYTNDTVAFHVEQRLVYARYKSEPYSGKATIKLLNQDGGLNSIPFIGSRCSISWGYVGGTKSVEEPLWVVSAKVATEEGQLLVQLDLVNAWEMLKYSKGINVANSSGSVPSTNRGWNDPTPADTVLDIITAIVSDSNGWLGQWGYTSVTQLAAESPDVIGTYEPIVHTRLGDADATLLRRLLQMTTSGMTFRSSTGATVNFINPAIPGPYYTYRNDGIEHPFFQGDIGNALSVPNRVIFLDIEPDSNKGQTFNWFGYAEDTVSMGLIGKVAETFYDDTIASNAEATARAEQMLARIQAEGLITTFTAPMNCCQELYDEIEIIDDRNGSLASIGRVGQLERIFIANANNQENPQGQRDAYLTTVYFGGIGGGSTKIKSDIDGSNDIEATTTDLKTRSFKDPFIDTPQINNSVLSQHYAPQRERRPATANRALTVAGGLQAITGATITLPIVPVISEARVNAMFEVSPGAGAAAGDVVFCILDLDGVQYNSSLVFGAASALDAKTLSGTWIVPIPADGVAHVLALKAQMVSGGAGTWNILSAGTDIIMELSAGANTRLF